MKTWLMITIASIAAFAMGVGVAVWLGTSSTDDEEEPYNVPRAYMPIAGEAREGCRLLGMDFDDIAADTDACLREYWTPERLKRSTYIQADLFADNGFVESCRDDVCDLSGDPDQPSYPPTSDPWWAEQSIRHPDRVTKSGVHPGLE